MRARTRHHETWRRSELTPTPESHEASETEKGASAGRRNDIDVHGERLGTRALDRGQGERVRAEDEHVECRHEPRREDRVLRVLDVERGVLRITEWKRLTAGHVVVVGDLHVKRRRRDNVTRRTRNHHLEQIEVLDTTLVVDVVVEVPAVAGQIGNGCSVLPGDLGTPENGVRVTGNGHIHRRLAVDRPHSELQPVASEVVDGVVLEVGLGLAGTDVPRRNGRGRRSRLTHTTAQNSSGKHGSEHNQSENLTLLHLSHLQLARTTRVQART